MQKWLFPSLSTGALQPQG